MKQLDQAVLEKQRMETDRPAAGRGGGRIEKLKLRIDALARARQLRWRTLTIRAPYDAVVISLAQRNAGSVVQSARNFANSLASTRSRSRGFSSANAACRGSRSGSACGYFFDAFPYQRYGTATGTLEWISPAAVSSADGRCLSPRAALVEHGIRAGGQQPAIARGDERRGAHRRRPSALIDSPSSPFASFAKTSAH